MKIYSASEILDKIHFGNYEDFDIYPRSTYKCSKCDEKISFSLKDFTKHSFSEHTNLTKEDVLKINEILAKVDLDDSNSFIDFYCPKCGRPVRIYYQAWAGGRHGEAGHELRFLIE
jgi:DNA-directed RNA polymerase subunit M/transcription elongation factor TFIIS